MSPVMYPASPVADTTTAALVFASLSSVGLNPAWMVAGFLGVIIVQSLLPAQTQISLRALCWLTVGSVLFASVFAPLAGALVVSQWLRMDPGATPDEVAALRALVAIFLGGFAQPLAIGLRTSIPAVIDSVRSWAASWLNKGA